MNQVKIVNCVKGEIHNLLAIMRFVPNFSASPDSVIPSQYINEFKELFQNLLVCSDTDSVDYWGPFLKVIQSGDVSGPITGVALSSIHKFLLYGFVGPTSGYTLNKIVNSVVQCSFPKFYTSNDEVVLMKLLHVFLECLRTPASVYLTDSSVWSMLKRCFDVIEKERVSELLKKTTQNTLLQMFLIVFGRISEVEDNECYGVPCLTKVLLHLAELVGYTEKAESAWKEKRCLGLFLLNTALETAGEGIGLHDKVLNVIQDDICKALLVNSTTDDLFILSLTLRVVFNLFQSVKKHLKVQLEVFFNSIHLKMASAYEDSEDPSIYQRSELALESIVDFCREPSLILELYTNYDCDVHFANLFESLCGFLCKHAFPLHQNLIRLNELCLEGLLAITNSVSMRCESEMKNIKTETNHLRQKKALKEKYVQTADVFNNNPKNFIPKLQEMNALSKQCDAKEVAKFLKENPAIDSTTLGEYLGKNEPYCVEVLEEFMKLFDYEGMRIDTALKNVLSSFKMPGEAQIIDRIIDAFSKAYYQADSIFADEGTVYLLAYSIIMLNTDLHNPGVKVKMSEESYLKNLQKVNGGKDFPKELLSSIYESIKNEPIQVLDVVHSVDHEELGNEELTRNKWSKIIKRTQVTGNYSMLNELLLQPAGENEKDMFDIMWESGLLGTLTNSLDCANSKKPLKEIKQLFMQVSKICAYFEMQDHINKLLSTLCQCFLRNTDSLITFYHNKRGKYSLEAAVGSSLICKDYLRGVWGHLVNCLLRLHSLKLLPQQVIELDDFVDSEGRMLPMANHELDETFFKFFRKPGSSSSSIKSEEETQEEAGGFWNSFAKYLGVPVEPTKKHEEVMQEIKQELRNKVENTGLHLLFKNTKALPLESLNYLLKTLMQRCKDSVEDINVVLCLELLSSGVLANAQRLSESIWKLVVSHLESMICSSTHNWSTERALVCHMRLCIHHHEQVSELRNSMLNVLTSMSELPPKKLNRFAARLIAGLLILLNSGNALFLIEGSGWNVLMQLLHSFSNIEGASKTSFELISAVVHHLHNLGDIELKLYEELIDLIIIQIKKDTSGKAEVGLNLINSLFKRISKKHAPEVVIYFWKKILGIVGKLCQEQDKKFRIKSYNLLQELILGNITQESQKSCATWKEIFERVLFPLVIEPFLVTKEALKNLSEERSVALKHEFEQSRERAMSLMCQTFLAKISIISSASDFVSFWLRLIKLMNQTLRNKEGEVNEKSFELMKNLMLVVKTEEVLTEEHWRMTWELVNLPELKEEVDPTSQQQSNING